MAANEQIQLTLLVVSSLRRMGSGWKPAGVLLGKDGVLFIRGEAQVISTRKGWTGNIKQEVLMVTKTS